MPDKTRDRFATKVIVFCAITIVIAVAHMVIREQYIPGHPIRLAITALLVLSFASFIFFYVQLLSRMDEYQRQIQLHALAIGFPLSLVSILGIGFFRAEGLLQRGDPRDLAWVLMVGYAVGFAFSWWRYR